MYLREIKSIKIDKDGVCIATHVRRDDGVVEETEYRSQEKPSPRLKEAFEGMASYCAQILEIDEETDTGALETVMVRFKRDQNATRSLSVSCKRKIACSNKCACFSTPYIPEECPSKPNSDHVLSDDACSAVGRLVEYAENYLDGHERAQTDLSEIDGFDEDESEYDEAEEEEQADLLPV